MYVYIIYAISFVPTYIVRFVLMTTIGKKPCILYTALAKMVVWQNVYLVVTLWSESSHPVINQGLEALLLFLLKAFQMMMCMILLMAEIPNNHLGCMKPYK